MLEGEIQTLPLPDLLQWLGHRRQDGLLRLTNSQGQQVELSFASGTLAAATLVGERQLGGAEEVREIFNLALTWRIGRFSYQDCALPTPLLQSKLRLTPAQLLAEYEQHCRQLRHEAAASPNHEDEESYSETFTQSDAMRMEIVDRLMRDDFSVPVMPQLAAQVWELTSTEDFSLRDLSRYVMSDQAVAARVLRYANSVANSRGQEIDSLNLAVQRLGANQVVNIVLAASLQTRPVGGDIFAAQKKQLWRHSVVKAFIAHPLAVCAGLNPGIGFVCGLLMDFGMNILYALIQDVLRTKQSRNPLPLPVIDKIVRDYHPRVGRVVGEKWDLPEVIIEAMAHHHSLSVEETAQPYPALAALADFLGEAMLKVPRAQLEAALVAYEPELLLCLPVTRHLNLSRVQVTALLATLPRHLDNAIAFLAD